MQVWAPKLGNHLRFEADCRNKKNCCCEILLVSQKSQHYAQSSGVLAPICGLSLLMVALVEEHRVFWCHTLQLARWSIIVVYFNTMYFNFLFRMILIRFADRGLVVKGKPELVLFRQLYWVVFAAFFTLGIFTYPVLQIIRGTFLQSTQARVCLFKPILADEEGIKGRISSLVYPCVAEVFNRYFSRKVFHYLNGICPNKRMSCIGNYRRNLIFFRETSHYVSRWACYSILEGTVMIVAMTSDSDKLTSTMVFWIHNVLAFTFIDIFHGLIIPLNMALPLATVPKKGQKFRTTRHSSLEPRRYVEGCGSLPLMDSPPPPPPSPVARRNWQTTGLSVWLQVIIDSMNITQKYVTVTTVQTNVRC